MTLRGNVLLHAPILFNEKLTPATILNADEVGVWIKCDLYEWDIRKDVQSISQDHDVEIFVPYSSIGAIIRTHERVNVTVQFVGANNPE